MAIQNQFSGRAAGFYLGLAGGVLAIAALICYIAYATASGTWNMGILLPLLAAIALQAVQIKINSDILTIVSPALLAASLCAFIMESVYTLVGYFMNLDMFGDASLIGYVAWVSILTGAAMIVLVIGTFLKKDKAE